MAKKKINNKPAPKGMRWVCCRFRKVRGNSGKKLDAHEYGYEAWCFLVPSGGPQSSVDCVYFYKV